jgi:hypothetical protein
MSELINILEKYKARSGDEQNFMDKHTENIEVTDAPGGEKGKEASEKMKKDDSKGKRKGYEPGEDEEMYEARQLKDPKKEMMVSKGGKVEVIDKKDWESYKKKGYNVAEEFEEGFELTEESLFQIIDESIEEMADELTEEEYAILREMVQTPESYKELVDSILREEDYDDENDDEEEDDEDDEDVVEKNPKTKKPMKESRLLSFKETL